MGAKDQGVELSRTRYHVVPRTLIFITYGSDVLLLKGSPDKRIWPNLYNGIGGHVERNETIYQAALREIAEETGLRDVRDLRLRGVINVDVADPLLGIMLFVFTATGPSRDVHPSREGTPEWVNWQNINPQMLVGDLPVILPRIMTMQPDDPPFFARYWYDSGDTLQIVFSDEGAS